MNERISDFSGMHVVASERRVPTPSSRVIEALSDCDLWTQVQVADDLRAEAVEDGNEDLARNFEVLMERLTDELERRGQL